MNQKTLTATDVSFATNATSTEHWLADGPRQFDRLGLGWYRWTVISAGIQFEIDRLRLERHSWEGELLVRCDLPGARTHSSADGMKVLSSADFNLSSLRARQERAKHLAERSNTKKDEIDWQRLVDEFCLRVLEAERAGEPAVVLRDLPEPSPDIEFDVDGLRLYRHLPSMIFGDGGTAKSMLALKVAGVLHERGIPALYCDWELSPEAHRARLRRLFGSLMPGLHYYRAERPLIAEADAIRRIVKRCGIQYLVLDSVAYACMGAPETSEAATEFYRASRSLGVDGQLWTAHQNKGEHGDQKPFGSVFWFNSARSIWNISRLDDVSLGDTTRLALYHRKSNSGPRHPAHGLAIAFHAGTTAIEPFNVLESPQAAARASVCERLRHALRGVGRRSVVELSEELEIKQNTIRKTAKDHKEIFGYIDDASGNKVVSLLERRR